MTQACISVTLDRRAIAALQLDIDPLSVAHSLLTAPKLKLHKEQIK